MWSVLTFSLQRQKKFRLVIDPVIIHVAASDESFFFITYQVE
jgi:hypothetical protein